MEYNRESPAKTSRLGSTLMLGFLVTTLSIFTALANYTTFRVGSNASDIETEGDRFLVESNTEYISATQFIIVDYNMYDSYYINLNVDDFAAKYYQSLFSAGLASSVERGSPFDDQYYDEMYASANEKIELAFGKFEEANALKEREAGYQFSMLFSAVGLAFAAYASLLNEGNRLRTIFSLMALITLILSVVQYIMIATG